MILFVIDVAKKDIMQISVSQKKMMNMMNMMNMMMKMKTMILFAIDVVRKDIMQISVSQKKMIIGIVVILKYMISSQFLVC